MIGPKDNVLPSSGIKLSRHGVVDFDKLIESMKNWISKRKYDFTEKKHSDKITGLGHEIKITWVNDREVTDYIKFHIDVDFVVYELNKTKTAEKNLYSGEVNIKFFAYLELDWKKRWRSFPFGSFLMYVYNNYLIKDKIKRYEGKLMSEV